MASDGSKVVVKQTRSTIGRNERVYRTLEALGLGRIGKQREITLNPSVRGMLIKVRHLVEIKAAS